METKLCNLIYKIIDNRGRNPKKYSKQGHPIIDNYLIRNELYPNINKVKRFIDDNTYHNFIRKHSKRNDILITLVGNSMGNVSLMPDDNSEIIQNTIGLRSNNKINQLYLFYLLLSKHKQITKLNRGSAQPSIKVADLLDIKLTIPSKLIQNKISKALFSIDSKIILNRQIKHNLIKLANYLFLRSFSDSYKRIDKLGKYLNIYDKKSTSLSKRVRLKIPGKYPYIGATSILGYINNYKLNGDYILLSEDGTVHDAKYHPIVRYVHGKFWPSDHVHILSGKNITNEWLYLFLKNVDIKGLITGAVVPKINQRNLKSISINVPSIKRITAFQQTINPIFQYIKASNKQNKTLTCLKHDLLLKFFN